MPRPARLPAATMRPRIVLAALPAAIVVAASMASASGQVIVYDTLRPVVAAPVVESRAYVANYVPAGNYAAVTAFSPPVMPVTAYSPPTAAVSVAPAVPVAASVASSSMSVTSYYAPTYPTATVAYTPTVATPVTAYYPPAALVPVRRGLFGRYRYAAMPVTYVVP